MTEADYICFLAKNISDGGYQKGGFVVLPQLTVDSKSVHFPDLNYSADFWNAIKRSKTDDFVGSFPQIALDEVISKLPHNKVSYIIKKEEYELEILETEYGTCGSFSPHRLANGKYRISISQRDGNSQQDLERTVLWAMVKIKNKDNVSFGTIGWYKRQAVVEYMYGKQKSRLSEKDIQESNRYLEKLGFGNEDMVSKIDFKVFTVQEENLLRYLIETRGEVVSFDKTAQILWGEESYDKYSPQAMAKVVENIRNKIRDQGINQEVVFTKRGKGYLVR